MRVLRVMLGGSAIAYSKNSKQQSPMMQATSGANAKRPLTPQEVARAIQNFDEAITHAQSKIKRCDALVVQVAMRGESNETIQELKQVIVERRRLRADLRRNVAMKSTLNTIDTNLSRAVTNAEFMDIVSRAGVHLERQNNDAAEERVDAALDRLQEGVAASDRMANRFAEAIEGQESADEELTIEEEIRAAFAAAHSAKATATLASASPVPTAAPQSRSSPAAAPQQALPVNIYVPQAYTVPRPAAPAAAAAAPSGSLKGFDSL